MPEVRLTGYRYYSIQMRNMEVITNVKQYNNWPKYTRENLNKDTL